MKKPLACILLSFLLLLQGCGDVQMITVSKIQKSRILRLDSKGIEMELTVNIKNPNNMGFNIYRAEFDVSVNGMAVGRGGIDKKMRIRANSDDAHTFTVSSDFSKLSFADLPKIMKLANSKSASIGLKGFIKAGKIFYKKTFEVDRTENVSF
ncbi:MAG: LEA type 2 family protein [Bacteroidota bacterium]